MDNQSVDGGLSYAVLSAIADREGVDPHNLTDQLYESLDPDALDSLFQAADGRVTFEFNGYIVTVDNEARVTLTDAHRQ